jgi:hypothetical protein
MATPIVIANAALLKVFWAAATRNWLNVYGAIGNPTLPVINQALADTLSQVIGAAFTSSGLQVLIATGVSIVNVSIKDLTVAGNVEFKSATVAFGGTGTGDPLPFSVSAVGTIRTAFAGKSGRGRSYLTGFTEAENDANGRSLPAVNAAVVSFLTSLDSGLQSHSMKLAVLQRPFPGKTIPQKVMAPRTGVARPMSSIDARNAKWESQRRRTGRQ